MLMVFTIVCNINSVLQSLQAFFLKRTETHNTISMSYTSSRRVQLSGYSRMYIEIWCSTYRYNNVVYSNMPRHNKHKAFIVPDVWRRKWIKHHIIQPLEIFYLGRCQIKWWTSITFSSLSANTWETSAKPCCWSYHNFCCTGRKQFNRKLNPGRISVGFCTDNLFKRK